MRSRRILARRIIGGDRYERHRCKTGEPDAVSVPIRIGRWGGAGHYPIGIIDEVAIFNIPLTEDEIRTIMTEGLERALPITAVSFAGKLATTWAKIRTRD